MTSFVNTPASSVDGDAAETLTTSSNIYQYTPLNENIDSIRLLILHPFAVEVDGKRTVVCDLVHTTFREKPIYEALSYTWGIPTDPTHPSNLGTPPSTSMILLDGVHFRVGENLLGALYNLRLKDSSRTLWCDAISIDQNNLKERTYQVGLMDYIYTRASSVLVWLGCLPRALNPFNSPNVLCFYHPISNGNYPSYNAWVNWIFQLPYWRRLWIIQEIALSMKLTVCIGQNSVPWHTFMEFAAIGDSITSIDPQTQEGVRLIHKLHSKRYGRHGDSNRLEVLLEDFQVAQCVEVRDKIYGLIGLSHDCQDGRITADYAKPLYQLYSDVMDFFCRRLQLSDGGTNELDRSIRLVKFSQLIQRLLGTSYQEKIPRESQNFPYPPQKTFKIKGARLCEVVHIGPTYNDIISSSKAGSKWRQSFSQHHSLPQDIQGLREAYEAYFPTLLAMTSHELNKIVDMEPSSPKYDFWSFGNVQMGGTSGREREGRSHVMKLLDTAASYVMLTISTPSPRSKRAITLAKNTEPKIFLGTNFQMGILPGDSQVGDIICHFWETDVAALMRPMEIEIVNGIPTTVYRVVGRVHLCTGSLEDLKPVYKPWIPIDEGADSIVIEIKLDGLSFLTC